VLLAGLDVSPVLTTLPSIGVLACGGLAFVAALKGRLGRSEELTVYLDATIIFLATAALILTTSAEAAAASVANAVYLAHAIFFLGLAGATLLLGIAPVKNLLSKRQRMNYSYNPLHIVNTYGAFGSVTKIRHEVVLEATPDDDPDTGAWSEYEFRAKPGPVDRRPPQVAPYHLRLDWLMWFLPFGVRTHGDRVLVPGYDRWFLRLVEKLLRADAPTLSLLRRAPFPSAPRYVRARYYRYEFADRRARRETGARWSRRLIGDFLPPTDLADFRLAAVADD